MRVLRVPLVVVLLGGAGCATLQPVPEPAQFIQRSSPDEVHVTFKNNSKVTMIHPSVRGDTLIGTVLGVPRPLAAPLEHVARVEALQRDKARTRWLVAGVGVLAAGGLFALSRSGTNDWVHPCVTAGTEECDWSQH